MQVSCFVLWILLQCVKCSNCWVSCWLLLYTTAKCILFFYPILLLLLLGSFLTTGDITPVMWEAVQFCERYKALYSMFVPCSLGNAGRSCGSCSPQWTSRHTDKNVFLQLFFRIARVCNSWQLLRSTYEEESKEWAKWWSGDMEKGQGC